jgi:hypothetical protein
MAVFGPGTAWHAAAKSDVRMYHESSANRRFDMNTRLVDEIDIPNSLHGKRRRHPALYVAPQSLRFSEGAG